jgi:hypothetical protein
MPNQPQKVSISVPHKPLGSAAVTAMLASIALSNIGPLDRSEVLLVRHIQAPTLGFQ